LYKHRNEKQKYESEDETELLFSYIYSRMARVEKMTSSLHDLLCQI